MQGSEQENGNGLHIHLLEQCSNGWKEKRELEKLD